MYMDIKGLSKLLDIKQATLYAWVERGLIPHYKVNRLIRFKESEIAIWLEGFKRASDDPESIVDNFLDSLRTPGYNRLRTGRNQCGCKESGKEK